MRKTCFKCKQEKPIEEFYVHKQMSDGHLNKCKECTKLDVKSHRNNPIYRDKILASDRLRGRLSHRREKAAEYSRENRNSESRIKWIKSNLEKRRIYLKVKRAVDSGKIIKTPCVICGNKKSEGHHEDYSKPLEVIWLCRLHHAELHRKYK